MRRTDNTHQRTMNRPRRSFDELHEVLASVACKWVPTVLFALSDGPKRNFQLRIAARGVSPKALTEALHRLVRDGMITHVVHTDSYGNTGLGYALTALGEDTVEQLTTLDAWARVHYPMIAENRDANPLDGVS